MKIERSFVRGRMNKSVDERLLPQGEYVDAMNIRLGSTEESEIGAIENARGNELIVNVQYLNNDLSPKAVCLGSLEDSENETIYWCVHDPENAQSATTGKVDMIVSYNTTNDLLIYHVISTNDGGGVNTALNFSLSYRVNAMTFIDGLLFFTENNNQPMRINVKNTYIEPSVNDLLVIVMPPSASPTVQLFKVPGFENYIETRFLSFSYRYEYRDGEYSALSQFSEIAFETLPFQLSSDTYQNEGMVNEFNMAQIGINTGGENVIGIDLVFKLSNQPVINVVEKFNKIDNGWSDNQNRIVNFTNRKVYTTLGISEILRVFDNVPRKAQAQTIMGNRLMYGNYVDGYDVKDANGNDCVMTYEPSVVTKDSTVFLLPTSTAPVTYTTNPLASQVVTEGKLRVDCSEVASNLVTGAEFNFEINLIHNSFTGATTASTTQPVISILFSYVLDQPYASISNMIQSDSFQKALQGVTIPTDLTQCGTSTQGFSTTDQLNCGLEAPQDSTLIAWNKDMSSPTAIVGVPITAIDYVTNTIEITFLAMRYVDAASPGDYLFEYYKVSTASASFRLSANKRSLHSERGYEVGIVYMDEFNRSTTALVSSNNTVFVSAINSVDLNSIQVVIPPNQRPPSWATRYKFVVKPSGVDYETIYSDLFIIGDDNGATYVKLEGDNQTKAAVGDRLIVKRDTDGPLNQRVETSILEIESVPADTITDNSPGGLYMQVRPNGYAMQYNNTSQLGGETSQNTYVTGDFSFNDALDFCPLLVYNCSVVNPDFDSVAGPSLANLPWTPWAIPVNSSVEFEFVIGRYEGSSVGSGCPQSLYRVTKTYVANTSYTSLHQMVIAQNINFDNGVNDPNNGQSNVENTFDPVIQDLDVVFAGQLYSNGLNTGNAQPTIGYPWLPAPVLDENQYSFRGSASNWTGSGSSGAADNYYAGIQYFQIRSGTPPCSPLTQLIPGSDSICTARIRVFSANNLLIFETIPTDSDPNIYYEGSDSYAITNGNHMSGGSTGDVNQDITSDPQVSGVVNLSFFNCFSFGNGAESYKIRDALGAPSFKLGERVTAVSEQDFKEAHRFADITYSGIYNADTNVNRLNEFNLATANFKELEKSFGPIRVLDARQSDILTLQEDKISYVLSSKTLLSSASGGGNVAAIPEVLGNQISRIEKFGISNNPESFVSWGFDKFFTDTKRGVVIQLKGSGQQEQLKVISDTGLGSWFRDFFILTPNTQKLGGYDPYMNEYVLSGNLTSLPTAPTILNCAADYTALVTQEPVTTWTVLLGSDTGISTVNWTAALKGGSSTITFNITYDGLVYTSGATTASSGSFTFNKNISGVNEAQVEVVVSEGASSFSVNVGCPGVTILNVIKVCLNNNTYNGQYIHNDYYWTQRTIDSPTSSDLVLLQAQDNTPINFAVSQYSLISGASGSGVIPPIPTVGVPVTIRIQSTKIGFDDFTFDPAIHQLRYALEPTLYGDTPTEMNTLLALSTILTPLEKPTRGVYYFDINYVQTGAFKPYLYLIYDYIT